MRGFWLVTGMTLLLFLAVLVWTNNDPDAPFLLLVFLAGSIGGLIREHLEVRRLIRQGDAELDRHLRAVLFSPVTGGILAIVAVSLFASGLIEGQMFPRFTGLDRPFTSMPDLQRGLGLKTQSDLFKLLIWSVVAGLFERFVVERLAQLSGRRNSG